MVLSVLVVYRRRAEICVLSDPPILGFAATLNTGPADRQVVQDMFAVAHVGVDLCLFVHGDNVLLRRVV